MSKKISVRRKASKAPKTTKRAPARKKGRDWASATGTPLLDHIEFNFVPYFVALTVVLLGLQLIVRRDGVRDDRGPASMMSRPGAVQLRDAPEGLDSSPQPAREQLMQEARGFWSK